jgi:hypothetical protein
MADPVHHLHRARHDGAAPDPRPRTPTKSSPARVTTSGCRHHQRLRWPTGRRTSIRAPTKVSGSPCDLDIGHDPAAFDQRIDPGQRALPDRPRRPKPDPESPSVSAAACRSGTAMRRKVPPPPPPRPPRPASPPRPWSPAHPAPGPRPGPARALFACCVITSPRPPARRSGPSAHRPACARHRPAGSWSRRSSAGPRRASGQLGIASCAVSAFAAPQGRQAGNPACHRRSAPVPRPARPHRPRPPTVQPACHPSRARAGMRSRASTVP